MGNKKVIISSSPHLRATSSTQSIMADVLIAMLPAVFCGVLFFGIRALFLVLISLVSSVLFEFLFQKLAKKEVMIFDLSAAVTGVLLGLNMPVTAPWWIPVIGSFVAIVIIKQLFGGIGANFMNPAMGARAFLLASWPVLMTRFVEPLSAGIFSAADVISGATPLAVIKGAAGELPPILDMFTGNIAGCIGETSVIALVIGGLYLVCRRVISLRIPVCFIGTVAILSFLFTSGDMSAVDSMLYHISGGGLFLGAIFMATDYVTSPVTKKGQILFAVGCGLITFVIRRFGGYPEGVTYGILLMNVVTPLIDKYVKPRTFGYQK